MKAPQKNGQENYVVEIYEETWNWLNKKGCAELVSQELIEHYAMSVSRWIQCQDAISNYGFLTKHPTTGAAIVSPYVNISLQYMKQANQLWYQIYQVVKENCFFLAFKSWHLRIPATECPPCFWCRDRAQDRSEKGGRPEEERTDAEDDWPADIGAGFSSGLLSPSWRGHSSAARL